MEQREIPGGVLLIGVEAFSLEDTLDCGQCFVFSRLPDGGFAGTAGGPCGRAASARGSGDARRGNTRRIYGVLAAVSGA